MLVFASISAEAKAREAELSMHFPWKSLITFGHNVVKINTALILDGSSKQLVSVLIYMQPGSWLYLSPDLMETKQSPEIVVLAFSEYIHYKVLSRTTAVPQQKHNVSTEREN